MKLIEFLKRKQIPCIEVAHTSNVRGGSFYISGGILPEIRIEAETNVSIGKFAYDTVYTLVQKNKRQKLYGVCHDFVFNNKVIEDPRDYGAEIHY